jgi:hypothetical protein
MSRGAVNPWGLTWQQWADAAILTLNDTWALGKPGPEEQWQDWATGLVRAPGYAQRTLPDPYQFSDWREWAMRVFPMLEGVD